MHFWKGCMEYEVCIGNEKLNTDDCYGSNPPLSCHFCCLGDYCNAEGLGNRTHVLKYLVTFTLLSNMTSELRDRTSSAHQNFKSTAAVQLQNAVQNYRRSNGTYFVDVMLLSDNFTVRSLIECTTIVEIDKYAIHSHIQEALEALDTVNNIKILKGSVYVGITDSDRCSKGSTSDAKGTYEWPQTTIGNTINLPCKIQPQTSSTALATRECSSFGGTAVWGLPDTSSCPISSTTTVKLTELVSKPVTDSNADDVASQVLDISKNAADYTDLDFNMTVYLLEQLENLDSTFIQRPRADNVANTISNLLDSSNQTFRNAEQKFQSSTRLHNVINKLNDDINIQSEDFSVVTPNLALFAVQSNKQNFKGMELRVEVPPGNKFRETEVTVIKDDQVSNKKGSTTNIVLPKTLLDTQQQVSRMTFVAFANDKLFSGIEEAHGGSRNVTTDVNGPQFINKVNSLVIAASVPGATLQNLQDPVLLTFQHNEKNAKNPVCGFWDETLNVQAGWSTRGCVINATVENSHTVCACDHLTNFALLMDVYRTGGKLSGADRQALSYISYIGCGVSLLGLLLTLITYFTFRKLRKDNPSKILINLCIALTFTNLIFLVGMQKYTLGSTVGCKVIAALLHYFLLAAMCWMGVEAFYMYLALVKIFNTYIAKFLLKSCLIGWGIPLVIVGITIGVNTTDNYGYQAGDICWLQPIPFYAAFLAPVGIIIILNYIAFVLVMKQICGRSAKILTKSDRTKTASRLRGAVSVVILLGLTWVFAIFAADGAGIIFTYLFAIFNSLQGFFIFVFYCLLKKDAQRAWKSRCCGRYDEKDSQTTKGYSSSEPSKSFSDITKDTDDFTVSTRGSGSTLNTPNGTTVKNKGRYPSYSDSTI